MPSDAVSRRHPSHGTVRPAENIRATIADTYIGKRLSHGLGGSLLTSAVPRASTTFTHPFEQGVPFGSVGCPDASM